MLENLGQLIIMGIEGKTLAKEEEQFIKENNIGGVIFFAKNYDSPAQIAETVNAIQACRGDWPLFISVDQEGGRVIRLKSPFLQLPNMLELATKGSPKLTFEAHKLMADQLSACGINLNFSPVCDVLTNPKNKVIGDRAFATSVEEVEKHVSAAIRGLHTGNVLACAKHFPGHGNTLKDSHHDLPYVKKSKEELEAKELLPFLKASKARVEFMMMAHLVVDAIDPDLPTSLSPKAYSYLREQAKFNKLIVTDDMEMAAITDHHGLEDAAVKAVKAGADLILYRSFAAATKALEALRLAYKKKELTKEEVDNKINRIVNVKERHLSNYKIIYIPDLEKQVCEKDNEEFLQKIYPKKNPLELINPVG